MTYQPVTPFRRMVEAVPLQASLAAEAPLPTESVDKWDVLSDLGAARQTLGVTDRELGVLQALLGFHPGRKLTSDGPLIVHPSNASICDRLNGMPCSTMRRHLGALVRAGLIVRRDSPNGKRFVRRSSGGERQTFGFDLSPLLRRADEIRETAEAARAAAEAYDRLRRTASLMRRDLAGLVAYGQEARPDLPIWDRLSDLAVLSTRALRRKLSTEELEGVTSDLEKALDEARDVFSETEEVVASGAHSERHYQNSKKDSSDLELCHEDGEATADVPVPDADERMPNIPLGLVTASCQTLRTFLPDPIRHWHQLVRAADTLRTMMGISPSAWDDAVRAMGPEEAAVVVVAMLERQGEIASPGGYLRHLARKAEEGSFSCGPMIMALHRKAAA